MLCISSGMNFAQGMWFLGHSSCYKSTGRAWGLNSPPIGKMLFLAFVDRGWPQTEGGGRRRARQWTRRTYFSKIRPSPSPNPRTVIVTRVRSCSGTLNSPPIGKMLFLAFVDRGWPQTEGGAGGGHGNVHAAPISQKLGHHRARIHELWLLVYAFFRDLAYI